MNAKLLLSTLVISFLGGFCAVAVLLPGSSLTVGAADGLKNDAACCNGDVNGDERINVSDAVYLLRYLFGSGPAPVAFADGAECCLPARERSFVSAYRRDTIGQMVPADSCIKGCWVEFDAEHEDTLDEYETPGGVFTAKNAGVYLVSARVFWSQLPEDAHYTATIERSNDFESSDAYDLDTIDASASQSPSHVLSAVIRLAVGQRVFVKVWNGGEQDAALGGGAMSVVRLY